MVAEDAKRLLQPPLGFVRIAEHDRRESHFKGSTSIPGLGRRSQACLGRGAAAYLGRLALIRPDILCAHEHPYSLLLNVTIEKQNR